MTIVEEAKSFYFGGGYGDPAVLKGYTEEALAEMYRTLKADALLFNNPTAREIRNTFNDLGKWKISSCLNAIFDYSTKDENIKEGERYYIFNAPYKRTRDVYFRVSMFEQRGSEGICIASARIPIDASEATIKNRYKNMRMTKIII